MLSSKDIRQQFISFFLERGHSFVHSSPVIPSDDPTLLFANAGMNQFKGIFLGNKEITILSAVNSQKCIRAGGKHNDLEEVGKDGYHHTFFEMLGNWSFGDYYKTEAITWAWELLTDTWKLPKELLYATVHDSDTEAHELWKSKTDIEHAHISFHGDKDNFWEMGESGPCGPCSEIHIDRGASACDKKGVAGHVCKVNGDCARYIELWNLVFIQYNREENRELKPLKHKFVDTGAGLERITQVLQNKHSNYETDLFMPIIEKLVELSKVPYDPENGTSHRVIADHVRCLCFALADGGFPSNEGRGYVLRRILRRAARHGRLLGFAEPFLHLLVDTVISVMGHHFTELNGKEDFLKMVIKSEEERFNKTLDTGLEKFNEIVKRTVGNTISGSEAFTLYDTFGFPLDLTMILAEEKCLEIDLQGFTGEMEAQRNRARNASKFALQNYEGDWIELSKPTPTEFVGYRETTIKTIIQRYSIDNEQNILVQLAKTPFYAESGGQVADTGVIWNEDFELIVHDTRKLEDGIIHYGNISRGAINNKPVYAEIDVLHRKSISRNHTATHLLHKALRGELGSHVQQKGSLVADDHFRFDFTHVSAVTSEEIKHIEQAVNSAILENRTVSTTIQSIESAKSEGAIALFGEKYSEEVRVVSVEGFSKELCGGTHVQATGELGLFKIITESSTAAGIRRIEAITGNAALAWVETLQEAQSRIAAKLHSPVPMLEIKLDAMFTQVSALEAQIKSMQADSGNALIDQLIAKAVNLPYFKLISSQTALKSMDELKQISDALKGKLVGTIAAIFNICEDKLNIICVVSADLLPKYHAGKIVGELASLLDGKGGGRPDSAMAGGKALNMVPEVMNKVAEIIVNVSSTQAGK
ncbi:MAG: alanine--tRNA ligase [Candidatus Cloacimonas sp.]|jgi:alanyl-tRNA synthetase|nr:alanine--tRNA ligase [Candidatus Cloacimonas sp.]